MALNPKLLIAGGVLSLFLFGNKKKPISSTSSTDSKTNENKKGDVGEPAGPDGCKIGLIEKDGICVNPKDPTNEAPETNNGGNGNKPSASELIISKDCKSFQFGDKTGDSWWKNKGEKVAKQWVESGELDPLIIAFNMIKKLSPCFKDFPLEENANHWFNLQIDRFEWINANRPMWNLLWSIRNRVDITQFNGVETIIADPTKPKLGLVFGNKGKNFSLGKWLTMLKPMIRTLIQLSMQASKNELGFVGTSLGYSNKDPTKFDQYALLQNIPTYIFTIIFPNVSVKEMVVLSDKVILNEIEIWKDLQSYTDEFTDEPLDLEGEGF